MFRGTTYRITATTASLFIATALSACGSDYTLDSKEDDPPVLTLDECATTGDQYMLDLAVLDCDVVWGVDIAGDISGHVNAAAVGLGVLSASGDYEGGGSCDLTIECEETVCLSEFVLCVNDYQDIAFCTEELAQCDTREFCQADKDECDQRAENMFNACIDSGLETFETCNGLYSDATWQCYCIYDLCTDNEWDSACEEDESSPPPPPPVPLAPRQWRVSRRLIDAQLARLSDLEVETPLWPVYSTATSSWRGARLAHVGKDSTLYALGLRSGDLLRMVNTIKVTDALVHPTLLLPLRNANQVRLVLERGGVSREHVYQIVP